MIRLARIGKKKYPTYRIIVSDRQKDTKGSYLESLGQYNPHTKPSTLELNKERLQYWLGVGAQLSDTLHNLCVAKGFIKGEKRNMMHKKPKKEEATPAEKDSAKPSSAPAQKQEAAPATPPKEEKKKS